MSDRGTVLIKYVRAATSMTLVTAVILTGCSVSDNQQPVAVPDSQSVHETSTGSVTATPPPPSDRPWTDPVDYFKNNPLPLAVQGSHVAVSEKLTGPQTLHDLDFTKFSEISVFISCNASASYKGILGTPAEPDKTNFGGESCGNGNLNSFTVPLRPKGPFTQFIVDLPTTITYYVAIYGKSLT